MNNTDNNQIVEDKHSKIEEIKEAMKKTDSKRMYQRYHVVFLHLKGLMNKDIAGIVGLCQHTIGKYVNAYKKEGLEGLKMGKSTGAPKFLTDEQEQKLFEVITTIPLTRLGSLTEKLGFKYSCQWVKSNFGIEYTHGVCLTFS